MHLAHLIELTISSANWLLNSRNYLRTNRELALHADPTRTHL